VWRSSRRRRTNNSWRNITRRFLQTRLLEEIFEHEKDGEVKENLIFSCLSWNRSSLFMLSDPVFVSRDENKGSTIPSSVTGLALLGQALMYRMVWLPLLDTSCNPRHEERILWALLLTVLCLVLDTLNCLINLTCLFAFFSMVSLQHLYWSLFSILLILVFLCILNFHEITSLNILIHSLKFI